MNETHDECSYEVWTVLYNKMLLNNFSKESSEFFAVRATYF